MRYHDPARLFVELWRGNEILSNHYCQEAADVTREADRLFNECCPPVEAT